MSLQSNPDALVGVLVLQSPRFAFTENPISDMPQPLCNYLEMQGTQEEKFFWLNQQLNYVF